LIIILYAAAEGTICSLIMITTNKKQLDTMIYYMLEKKSPVYI